jgi:hypothetical protein
VPGRKCCRVALRDAQVLRAARQAVHILRGLHGLRMPICTTLRERQPLARAAFDLQEPGAREIVQSNHRALAPRAASACWPREHGAYVQLLAPLLSALAFARPTPAALACAALALALFLAHEPLVVLLGRRGAKCRLANARAARVQLLLRMAVAALLGLVLTLAAPAAGRALLLPAALSLGALATLLRGQEKSLLGELLAAAALTSFSVPVLVAQDVPLASISVFVSGWLTAQALATLTARAYVYRRRDGERPLQLASVGAVLLLGLAALLVREGHVPLAACLALGPFALLAAALHLHAYRPRTPKGLGWALTIANLAAVVLFGTTLPNIP